MNGECTCSAWALRIDAEPWFHQRAITYNCPAHGTVTIDDRPLTIRYLKRQIISGGDRAKHRTSLLQRWEKTA